MSNVEKISVSLPKEMTATMKDAVNAGAYASTSEIVRDALRDWQEKQLRKGEQLTRLRRMLQGAIDSGPGVPFDAEGIKRRGRLRLAAIKKSA